MAVIGPIRRLEVYIKHLIIDIEDGVKDINIWYLE